MSVLLALVLSSMAGAMNAKEGVTYKDITVEAPFQMSVIKEPVFPAREFPITKYGAKVLTEAQVKALSASQENALAKKNGKAIAKAIKACNKAGGGRVVIPAGAWVTGPVHLMSNVDLHLSEGAVLSFTDNSEAYLPAVQTSWEGMECMNYSPLVYAYGCENVAISGKGTLKPQMDLWRKWFARPKAHMEASRRLYTMASTDVPVKERQMAVGENHFRPQLIQFNRCKNISLQDFSIRESPFWTIHMLMCKNGVARGLNVYAHGHNNDGIDLEMTQDFLVENCVFDQGDDAVVIKSGRNQDAWRTHTPTANVVIRNCDIVNGHVLLGIGSEISGGIRNIYMHDCHVRSSVKRVFYVKTNHRRGAFVENVYMKNCSAEAAEEAVVEIDPDVIYQWKAVPTYATKITKIDGLHVDNVTCKKAKCVYRLIGDLRLPPKNIEISNIKVGTVTGYVSKTENILDLTVKNVSYNRLDIVPAKK